MGLVLETHCFVVEEVGEVGEVDCYTLDLEVVVEHCSLYYLMVVLAGNLEVMEEQNALFFEVLVLLFFQFQSHDV